MKTARRLATVIVLVCLICNAASFGEGTDKAKTELKFEISSQIYNTRGGHGPNYRRIGYGGGTETSNTDKSKMIKQTHVAFMGASKQLFSASYLEPDALLKTPSGQSMSDLQKEFVKQGNACEADFVFFGGPGKYILRMHSLRGILLFAVSEDDAIKMAAAFIESWQNNMGAEVQKLLEKKKEFEKKAAERRKRHAEKRKELDELEKTFKEKSSKGLHSLDGDIAHNSEAKGEEARRAARQLYIELNLVNIEIKIIKARLSAATVYMARENANPTVQAKLEEILCEQTIELAGTLERQAGITTTLRQEEEIYRLYEQFSEAGRQIDRYNHDASLAEHNLKRAIEEFEKIDSSYPRVTDNKVIIRPVEF